MATSIFFTEEIEDSTTKGLYLYFDTIPFFQPDGYDETFAQ
jgi:hypothetical protein